MKDLFISNGVKRQFMFGDFTESMQKKSKELNRDLNISEINELSITGVTPNTVYRYLGDYKYKKTSDLWMDEFNFNSNGIAYGDLDNDGDLDLVTNNMDDNVSLYESKSANGLGGNFIKLTLIGPEKNRFAIGSKIKIKKGSEILYQELHNAKGYLSSVDHSIIFGLGEMDTVPKIEIIWPDGKSTFIENLPANNMYSFSYDEAIKTKNSDNVTVEPSFRQITSNEIGITYQHTENSFDDFENQILLPYSQSHNGPFISKADVNNDGLEDFFVGGAANQSGELYIQNSSGKFNKQNGPWSNDNSYEDLESLFFDFDNDGDQDLYVVSGGSEFPAGNEMFQDRLYANDGKGYFSKTTNALPPIFTSGQSVKVNDIDKDGDLDIFIGGRIVPDKYPYSPNSHLLLNENGSFVDVTNKNAPDIEQIGMVTDAIFVDYDQDGDNDLIVVGEWTPIQFLENENGVFEKISVSGLENSVGLWFSIAANDIDKDGDLDLFVGNLGSNSKFHVGNGKSFHIYCDDFDQSGTFDIVLSNTYKNELVPVRGRECSSQQMPFIAKKFPSFQSFAEANLTEIYGQEKLNNALHYEADLLESIFIENQGDGKFEIKKLPIEAQFSPIQDFEFLDIDKDGVNEILSVGNIYNTEVETSRLDASYGCVLKYGEDKFSIINSKLSGLSSKGDARDICVIKKGNNLLLLVARNNEALNIFEL
ncbi:MAG: VCBS repeat-containing protein [Bacteroidetes bacterium]|nr:VCBS repeat-containing protein [Bacteroidota bacterium]